ncbi:MULTISPECIES: hypothetical protein [unclassified Legionella]|uniref:hypothetical protein n=1 Tax=unclassified Legionella TaxID=2622702 RepID=UPI0010547125|nr:MULTISPECIES: hypothetical protein [unclassified Legionella]MDI9817994.1 hypothetical protein [Legionella sp. PL877]
MTGYLVLSNVETEHLLAPKPPIITGTVIANDIQDEKGNRLLSNPFSYYKHPDRNLIIITTPLPASEVNHCLKKIKSHLAGGENVNYNLLLGITGQGVTEQHIVTAYVRDGEMDIFDPKASNPQRFFSGEGSTGSKFLSLLRSLNPFPHHQFNLADGTKANYHALGTQSFFDGVSCGYHYVANIMACKELIENGQAITAANLLTKTGNPVSESANILRIDKNFKNKVDSNFLSFMKKAWLDTVMPLEKEEERSKLGFRHYLLGWPKERGKQVIYFLTLSFIILPLINLIRRPVEFVFNALSETANYLKNRLINWAPTHPVSQYFRSALMLAAYGFQGLFKGAYLALRTVTSPISSVQAALAIKNPKLRVAMAVLSVVLSIAAFAALAYFAAPLLLGASLASAPVLSPLAYPFSQLFALVGINLAPATAAAALLITAGTFYHALKSGIGAMVSKITSKPTKEVAKKTALAEDFAEIGKDVNYNEVPGSNVGVAFKRAGVDSKVYPPAIEEDFKFVSSDKTSTREQQISASSEEKQEFSPVNSTI